MYNPFSGTHSGTHIRQSPEYVSLYISGTHSGTLFRPEAGHGLVDADLGRRAAYSQQLEGMLCASSKSHLSTSSHIVVGGQS